MSCTRRGAKWTSTTVTLTGPPTDSSQRTVANKIGQEWSIPADDYFIKDIAVVEPKPTRSTQPSEKPKKPTNDAAVIKQANDSHELQELCSEEYSQRNKIIQEERNINQRQLQDGQLNEWGEIIMRTKEAQARAEARKAEEQARALANPPRRPRPTRPPPVTTDNDHEPIPTQRKPAHKKKTIATFRGVISRYPEADPGEKTEIFDAFLSHTKATLKAVPPTEPTTTSEARQDPPDRTTARALSLAARGFIGRAAATLARVIAPHTLTPDEQSEKLEALHPPGADPAPLPPGMHTPDLGITVDDVRKAAKATGAAPGPNGLTDEIIAVLLQDNICAKAITAMITDIVNNDIAPSIRERLTRCRLVALPKPDGSVRPVAIGDTLMKIAGKVTLAKSHAPIARHFGDLQFGCLREGGAEIIAHNIRHLLNNGYNMTTLDAKNAFNCVDRNRIQNELIANSGLHPLLPMFRLEYASPSDLLFFSKGALHSVIKSRKGTRQGSALGAFYFCLAIHPALRKLKEQFPDVEVYAYMDDITLLSPDSHRLALATLAAQKLLAEAGLDMNTRKCEWFGPDTMPRDLQNYIGSTPDIIKVLGAYYGDDNGCAEKIKLKMEKHAIFFERLGKLPASACAFAILQKAALPRLCYLLRTHSSALTTDTAIAFDSLIAKIMVKWANVADTPHAHARATLPITMGGLGLGSQVEIAEIAYEASRTAALKALGRLEGALAQDQHTATHLLHERKRAELAKDPQEARHLDECSLKFAGAWLTAWYTDFQGAAFSAALRYRLNESPADSPAHSTCRGCNKVFAARHFDAHVAGCVSKPGFNATTKHNSVVRLLKEMCDAAYLPAELEPRELEAYKCHTCGELVSGAQRAKHGCTGSFSRTGPDLRIYFGDGSVLYDLTVVHVTAPSYQGKPPKNIIAGKVRHKTAFYTPHVGDEPFVVLPARALGGIEKPLLKLVRQLARMAEANQDQAIGKLSAALAQGVGNTLVSARRALWSRWTVEG
jgi:hypothetical protein